MKRLFLTPEEKTSLELRHQCCENRKEGDRIKAVLLRSEGWTVPLISQALRIHQSTIIRHIQDYQAGKLRNESGGSLGQLSKIEEQELIFHLEMHTYHHNREIVQYVKERFGIEYSVSGMNKWLHRNGFSYKRPKGYPHKANQEAQEKFIDFYTKLKENLGSEEDILFMDSCHPTMATKISHGWIKKGQSKPIETTDSRTRVNLVGALRLNAVNKPIIASYSTVDSESIVDFFQQVRGQSGISGKIYLILDQAGYHRAFEVIKEAERLNIQLHYLPAYSPNLNPIERLWKVMNEYSRNNRFFKTAQEFRERLIEFFTKTLPKIASTLKSRINDNFQKLNYAF